MLPAQPAYVWPHLCPERTLHGIVDCRALESVGSTIERGKQEHEDLSPHCSARAELRGLDLAEGTHKESLAQPSHPQVPHQSQPRRAHEHKHQGGGDPNDVQTQQPAGHQHSQKNERVSHLKQNHGHQHQEKHSGARHFAFGLEGAFRGLQRNLLPQAHGRSTNANRLPYAA
eukprot:scaffold24380_cov63-Phaeocystis_antarctica.AAC.5